MGSSQKREQCEEEIESFPFVVLRWLGRQRRHLTARNGYSHAACNRRSSVTPSSFPTNDFSRVLFRKANEKGWLCMQQSPNDKMLYNQKNLVSIPFCYFLFFFFFLLLSLAFCATDMTTLFFPFPFLPWSSLQVGDSIKLKILAYFCQLESMVPAYCFPPYMLRTFFFDLSFRVEQTGAWLTPAGPSLKPNAILKTLVKCNFSIGLKSDLKLFFWLAFGHEFYASPPFWLLPSSISS